MSKNWMEEAKKELCKLGLTDDDIIKAITDALDEYNESKDKLNFLLAIALKHKFHFIFSHAILKEKVTLYEAAKTFLETAAGRAQA